MASIGAIAASGLIQADAKPQQRSDAELAERLVGTWELKLPERAFSFRRSFFSLKRDGTFSTIDTGAVLGSDVRAEGEGKWRVESGSLAFDLGRSSLPIKDSKVRKHRIVSVDDKTLVVDVEYQGYIERGRRSALPRPLPPLITDVVTILSDEVRSNIGVSTPKPTYPPKARKDGAQGTGVFVLALDSAGSTSSVRIAKSTGNTFLDSAAIAGLRQWRFKPGSFAKGLVEVAFVL